ncbi:MAG: XdhC family protein [Chitinophagaceae bacterium]|nr:XdhC family protein [Chitinophagaceae bacterium]
MKETEDIIRSYKLAQAAGKKTALATVVHVEGSSYRRPGARMLVTEDGELTGAISGGCLEGDALRKALLAIAQQQNKLVTYDSMDEEDNAIGIQLGCNGIVHILFEPIDPANTNNPVALLEKLSTQTNTSVLVTLFSLDDAAGEQPGTCLLFADENYHGSINNQTLEIEIKNDVMTVVESNKSLIKKYILTEKRSLTGFIERISPAVELIIAGAGNDAFPLVQMAAVLGWHVTVMDGRKTHANANRFSTAKKIMVGKPVELVGQISINEQTVFVLMSHNYNYDVAMLRQLIHAACNYIGVLGPKKKLEKMLNELSGEGLQINDADKEKIYGPVGLDIGAETAEEIALSVLAEIKAVLAKKEGTTLRRKKGFIHDHSMVTTELSNTQ